MNVIFKDMQKLNNPLNGNRIENVSDVECLFRSFVGRDPFLFELQGENEITLTIGFTDECASIQYSASSGLPPYFMAISDEAIDDSEYIEFLAGDTPTPISRRYCLPTVKAIRIVNDFVQLGIRSKGMTWEEV
jgi:hypothetical protein